MPGVPVGAEGADTLEECLIKSYKKMQILNHSIYLQQSVRLAFCSGLTISSEELITLLDI
jgi:hypothetical protein